MKAFLSYSTCLLLLAFASSAVANDGGSAVFDLVTSDCPAVPAEPAPATVASDSECVLRCTLDTECRMSLYLIASGRCYSLTSAEMEASTGICNLGLMIVRRKRPSAASPAFLTLSFWPIVPLFYNFKKGFNNLADSTLFPAQPVNISDQNGIDGVRLRGSSNSFVRVSTPGFYRYFYYGQRFGFFFQAKFSSNNETGKCISAFADLSSTNPSLYSSWIQTQADGKLFVKTFFSIGSYMYIQWVSKRILALDSVERVVSFGINFNGVSFDSQAFFNGSALDVSSHGWNPNPTNRLTIHDDLLLGRCTSGGAQPFDGWLQCWSLFTGNLGMQQFEQLRSLCNS